MKRLSNDDSNIIIVEMKRNRLLVSSEANEIDFENFEDSNNPLIEGEDNFLLSEDN